jgi:hypothetical protein
MHPRIARVPQFKFSLPINRAFQKWDVSRLFRRATNNNEFTINTQRIHDYLLILQTP